MSTLFGFLCMKNDSSVKWSEHIFAENDLNDINIQLTSKLKQ